MLPAFHLKTDDGLLKLKIEVFLHIWAKYSHAQIFWVDLLNEVCGYVWVMPHSQIYFMAVVFHCSTKSGLLAQFKNDDYLLNHYSNLEQLLDPLGTVFLRYNQLKNFPFSEFSPPA